MLYFNLWLITIKSYTCLQCNFSYSTLWAAQTELTIRTKLLIRTQLIISIMNTLKSLLRYYSVYLTGPLSVVNAVNPIKKMTTKQEQMSKCIRLCQEHFGGAWHRLSGYKLIESAVKPLRYVTVCISNAYIFMNKYWVVENIELSHFIGSMVEPCSNHALYIRESYCRTHSQCTFIIVSHLHSTHCSNSRVGRL